MDAVPRTEFWPFPSQTDGRSSEIGGKGLDRGESDPRSVTARRVWLAAFAKLRK